MGGRRALAAFTGLAGLAFGAALAGAPGHAAQPAAAPSALQVRAGDGEVSLSWDAPTTPGQVVDYEVQYQLVGAAGWTTWVDGVSTAAATTVRPPAIGAPATPEYGLSSRPVSAPRTCAVVRRGQMACWGDGNLGARGDTIVGNEASPTSVATRRVVRTVTAGAYHTCGLTRRQRVVCWGGNRLGELGVGIRSPQALLVRPPVRRVLPAPAELLAAGAHHTCAAAGNEVACWGANQSGQLGTGTRRDRLRPAAVDLGALGGAEVVALDAGANHTCAIGADGTLVCWGANESGQLGTGDRTSLLAPAVIDGGALAGERVVGVSAGAHHTCAVTATGIVACWGANESGQLGTGNRAAALAPTAVTGGDLDPAQVTLLAAGGRHTCASSARAISCWGDGRWSQLGDGTATDRLAPRAVALGPLAGADIVQLAAGPDATCAVAGTQAACWGNNRHGQLGTASDGVNVTPTPVATSARLAAVALGDHHVCLAVRRGPPQCAGAHDVGQLGTAHPVFSNVPVTAQAGEGLAPGITRLVAGTGHTCVVDGTGAAACWGDNRYGQLGDGTRSSRAEAGLVVTAGSPLAGVEVTDLDAGGGHTCAIASGGTLACWGENLWGQLGTGGSRVGSLVPVAPALAGTALEGQPIVAVATGGAHTCAATASAVACWGRNANGQLGDGTRTDRARPVAIGGALAGASVVDLVAGPRHTCALTADGEAVCWGNNGSGQVGVGGRRDQLRPSFVDRGALTSVRVVALSPGEHHTCALTTVGRVVCWGANEAGQLGTGSTVDRLTPVTVTGGALAGADVTAIAAGARHTCAATAEGQLACWGLNLAGQLGTGSFANSLEPVRVDVVLGGTLRPGAAYQFRVAAVSDAGRGPWTSPVTARVPGS